MDVKLIQVTCPGCGAPLEYDFISKVGHCKHCSSIIMPTKNSSKYIESNIIDEISKTHRFYKLSSIIRNKTYIDSSGSITKTILSSQLLEPQYPHLIPDRNLSYIKTKKLISDYILSSGISLTTGVIFSLITSTILFFIISIIPFIILMCSISYVNQKYKKENLEYHMEITLKNRIMLDKYKYAKIKFNDLYYCETHDKLINIETGETFTVEELYNLLYPNQNPSLDKALPSS